jgi:hypothetical protein
MRTLHRMPILRLALAASAALLISVPAVAHADRAPTEREHAAVSKAVGVPKRCMRVRISTVDEHWARANVHNRKASCADHAADGLAVFQRRRGVWRFVTAGSSFHCPVPDVPRRIARDLKIPCEPR